MAIPATLDRLKSRLERETTAEVRFDYGARALYATDASLYEIEPLGVVVPRSRADVHAVVKAAFDEGVPILPRGAATSLSGQTVGAAIVIDFSKYLNRIGVVDRDRRLVHVEPGVVLDQLNARVKPLGLMFGPDVSTSDRATIGGMIGNNSAGARSLRYGKTVDHVESVDVALDDGTAATFQPLDDAELGALDGQSDRVARLHRAVRDTAARHESAIRQHFPRILRRVSGYNLDEFIPGLPTRPEGWPKEAFRFNLSRLIVGSEGTLAVVTGALVRLVPLPKATGLAVLSFDTIDAALARLAEMLDTKPVAIEMLDRLILDLAAANPETAKHLDFTCGTPEAVLAAQFHADSAEEIEMRLRTLQSAFEGSSGVLGVRTRLADAAKDSFWKVRKAGLSLLMGLVGDAKPVAFVEDTAVDPARLPEFYRRFRQILDRHGARGACYGHADVGCLHIRPILNMKRSDDVVVLRSIAAEVSDLVLEFGGAMSGEHGDGLARSVWNAKLFGAEVYSAFQSIKSAFDPFGRLNPGKVVGDPDPGSNLRISPDYAVLEPPTTILDFSKQGGFARAIEMCSGVGVCRKTDTGTMCPSYMVTRDEDHSTRGRANLLRLAITGALPNGLNDEALADALDLCLQCKACKTECPSNVDLAKLKAEVLYQKHRRRPIPIGHLMLGNIFRLNPIAAAVAPLANWSLRQRGVKWLLEQVAGIERRRTLPAFEHNHLRRWFRKRRAGVSSGARGRVVLLDDCFTTYNDPEVGRAAVRLLETAGYEVQLAGIRCCGRAAMSKGLLDLGRELAEENVRKLLPVVESGALIVGCEPSCVLTFVDEYRELRLGSEADELAEKVMMIEAFLADRALVPELPLAPRAGHALFHGHCQQKALVGTAASVAALKRIPDLEVRELDSGCCGMAGSFGYEKGHFDVSSALAERVLLPAARADPSALLVAPGFSCRSQVHGLAGLAAVHPVQVLSEQLLID